MKCVYCGGDTKVVDVATRDDMNVRRRRCLKCGKSFLTREALSETELDRFCIADKKYRYKHKGENYEGQED